MLERPGMPASFAFSYSSARVASASSSLPSLAGAASAACASVGNPATGDAKRDAFDDLVRLLAIHETAEEEVVHPISRGLLLLRNAILTHARYEERYEFPELRAKVPAERLRTMATAVRAAEAVAPTRPHPGAELAKANIILGPPLAVVDRARDLIREATKRSDS
jgi:hypothetical protein